MMYQPHYSMITHYSSELNALKLRFNTLRPRQMDAISQTTFSMHFLDISLKFVPEGRINNIRALVQIMAWRRLGDKLSSELMMVSLLTHICVTRPQWVKQFWATSNESIFWREQHLHLFGFRLITHAFQNCGSEWMFPSIMMTSSNVTFSALLDICARNSLVTGEFLAQRPMTRSFDVFFDLRLNKRISKQWRDRWFEKQSRPLWCYCNVEAKSKACR